MADVSVSCSKREGLPLNIVEAMLSGTPVVASMNRGHRELIRDGENGYLVAVENVSYMFAKIIRLLQNKQNYDKLQRNAFTYTQAYTFSSVKKELQNVYRI